MQGLLADRGRADYRIVIAGTMPKWRQYFNRFAGGFMCVLFAGLGLISVHVAFAATDRAPIIVSLIFIAFTTAAIAGQFWFQRRIVSSSGRLESWGRRCGRCRR